MMRWASEFHEIPDTLAARTDLRARMHALLSQNMPGKATEGGSRLDSLRAILADLIDGQIALDAAIRSVQQRLPREQSPHASNNRVFPSGWDERLVRTQFSRLYNQAALEHLAAANETQCFIAHSSAEAADSPCSISLAGGTHEISELLARLIESYVNGNWSSDLKIPNHPHCTHVVSPRRDRTD